VPGEQQRAGIVGTQILDAQGAGQADNDAPDVGVEAGAPLGLVGGGVDFARGLAGQVQRPADQPGRCVATAQRVHELGRPEVLMHVDAALRDVGTARLNDVGTVRPRDADPTLWHARPPYGEALH
jgi:hypothetical protein